MNSCLSLLLAQYINDSIIQTWNEENVDIHILWLLQTPAMHVIGVSEEPVAYLQAPFIIGRCCCSAFPQTAPLFHDTHTEGSCLFLCHPQLFPSFLSFRKLLTMWRQWSWTSRSSVLLLYLTVLTQIRTVSSLPFLKTNPENDLSVPQFPTSCIDEDGRVMPHLLSESKK